MATTDLGKWMITNGGEYNPDTTYEQLTMVLYENSTYITLRTVTGITPNNDKINYILMAQGFSANALADVVAKDTYGAIGDVGESVSAQSLIDYLTNEVVNNLIKKTSISTVQTNSQTTVPSSSLAYSMQRAINDLNSNLADAIIKSTYKTALRSPDKTHTLGIHDNGTAYMDDTKVITNADFQAGTITITSQANTTITQKVTFPTAFSAMPKVTLTPMTSDPEKVVITPSAVTTTGFQANLRATVSNAYTISWIAAN